MVGIENERVTIPEVTAGKSVTTDLVLKGFDNKTIRRILLCNTPTGSEGGVVATDNDGNITDTILCNGKLNSLAQHNMSIQLTVNGANIFNGAGLTGHNHRAGVLADTFGDIILTPYGNSVGVYGETATNKPYGAIEEFGFGRDYTGFSVNNAIRTLQLSYTRTGLTADGAGAGKVPVPVRPEALNQALNLNIYAEAIKFFRIGNGGYNIAYV